MRESIPQDLVILIRRNSPASDFSSFRGTRSNLQPAREIATGPKDGRKWFFEYAYLENEDKLLWDPYKTMKTHGGVVNTRMYIGERLPLVRHPGRGNPVDVHALLATQV